MLEMVVDKTLMPLWKVFFANCTNYCCKHNLRSVVITHPEMLKKTWNLEDTAINIMTIIAVPSMGAAASVAWWNVVHTPCHIAGLASYFGWCTTCNPWTGEVIIHLTGKAGALVNLAKNQGRCYSDVSTTRDSNNGIGRHSDHTINKGKLLKQPFIFHEATRTVCILLTLF